MGQVTEINSNFKSFFHKFRDAVRQLRIYGELRKLRLIRQTNPRAVLFMQTANLGEVYLSCICLHYYKSAAKDIVMITLQEQQYTTKLMALFPHIAQYHFVSRRTAALLNDGRFAAKFNVQPLNIYEHSFGVTQPGNLVAAFKAILHIDGDLPLNTAVCPAQDEAKAAAVLAEFSLERAKTVIITPEAKSFNSPLLSDPVWLALADRLVEAGYGVIFNSKKPYLNYPALFLTIGETVALAKLCGHVIGVRSGLLDILAGETDAFIQALYPSAADVSETDFSYLTRFDIPQDISTTEKLWRFFSLKNIRDDGKITEIILAPDRMGTLVGEMIDTLIKRR